MRTENDYEDGECSSGDKTVLEIEFLTVLLCPKEPKVTFEDCGAVTPIPSEE